MTRWMPIAVAAVAFAALACNGSSRPGNKETAPAGSASPTTTAAVTSIFGTPKATASSLEELRDGLASQLDSIGVNIGSVPADVRRQILGQCQELGRFADQKKVDTICGAVQQSMNTGDYGLLDQAVTQLRALKEK